MLFWKIIADLVYYEMANVAVLLYAILGFTKWSDSLTGALVVALCIAVAAFYNKWAIFFDAYRRNATDARAALLSYLQGYRIVEAPDDFLVGDATTLGQLKETTGKARVLLASPRSGYEPMLTFKSFIQPTPGAYRTIVLLGADGKLGIADRFYLLHELCHASVPGHIREVHAHKATYRLILLYFPLLLACQHWLACSAIAAIAGLHLYNATERVSTEIDADWNAWRLHERYFGPQETVRTGKLIAYLFSQKAAFEQDPEFKVRSMQARRIAEILETDRTRFDLYKKAPTLGLPIVILVLSLLQVAAASIAYLDAIPTLPWIMLWLAPLAAVIGVVRSRFASIAAAKEESLSAFVDAVLEKSREIDGIAAEPKAGTTDRTEPK
ncbi:hypothetical protein ACH79_16165 [Bradyrhizobium sp. CCBAU 051011]|uniref:hypothetical protein n=1 Tax=Bradyrhizobium sp. CCBAU 051011 TaxID=858422 RepID=UPI00137402AE|nr:hypothetical protein [Bradyrhizobium sp. CCBAU 051011]QHO73942.1 hypothetical protein ACH79_16165 [Bradyrhizobium sp. CCBAU 051011]